MFKFISKISFCVISMVSLSTMAQTVYQEDREAFDPQLSLISVDAFRSESDSVKISATVRAYDNDSLKNEKQFDVYSSSNKKSLVVFKSASEQGQKVLMKESDFWMFMPRSRRPIRITPLQKLLGEASLGDIATLSWSKDYQVSSFSSDKSEIVFNLSANSSKASYQKIQLTVDKSDLFPLKAELYLRSGKHAKTATFDRGQRNGKSKVVAMSLQDQMQPGKRTVIAYDEIKPIKVPSKLFNPQILIRSDLDKLLTQ
ncbi:MAG: outer membrane lipoprotein-sorting protein [Pseudoalteromonadaceae bacterium]|nr:outer membrane lipoprotein-sorting protein [Pseudoalteromonadaceae bacterium]|tara:strand:- start:606 stop:1376 length:771 start_codon:yes stop_codon:yes gene_type:complete